MSFKSGDWVEVLSKEEILDSLDSEARLEGLPFMPEMLKYAGRKFKVYKRAHKTCDTATLTGGRQLPNGIHLDLRCDGSAHGGCQAACLLFWKEGWLKPTTAPATEAEDTTSDSPSIDSVKIEHFRRRELCSEQNVWNATRSNPYASSGEFRYTCQATELPRYTTRLRWWNPLQYLEDYRAGNVTLGRLICGLTYATFAWSAHRRVRALAPTLHWLYDRFQAVFGGIPFPRRYGIIQPGHPAPHSDLDLRPGELVRVKSYVEILATLDTTNKNAGLFFDAEMVPFCGHIFRVKDRVHQFIDEKSGKMSYLKTPAVILDKVWCQARYSSCRVFCPRSIFSWWREVWLERVTESLRDGPPPSMSRTDVDSELEQSVPTRVRPAARTDSSSPIRHPIGFGDASA
jgi:hypothetical protein